MKHDPAVLHRAAEWAGNMLSLDQVDHLTSYADWLVAEAIPASAVGPEEGPRILDRHVADSLVFGAAWGDEPPSTLVDVGSGVGLPGIPLAIAHPVTTVTLLDRSQGRTDLAQRAVRILGLPNVDIVTEDVREHSSRYDAVTFRASLPAREAVEAARTLLEPAGIAVIGLHRGDRTPENPAEAGPGESLQVVKTPNGILDSTAWHLRMTVT